eukprot:2846562-Amphidinium_carterae.1
MAVMQLAKAELAVLSNRHPLNFTHLSCWAIECNHVHSKKDHSPTAAVDNAGRSASAFAAQSRLVH